MRGLIKICLVGVEKFMIEVNDLLNSYATVCRNLGCETEVLKDGELLVSKDNDEISIVVHSSMDDEIQMSFYRSEQTSNEFVTKMMNLFAETYNSFQI